MSLLLSVADLLAPGQPLASGVVLTPSSGLGNRVTWAVSLRPYAPAIPVLKGGELALVSTDMLARHEPPVTLADVVRQLRALNAAGLALRGNPDPQAIATATDIGLPLIQLPEHAMLHEIEQAIMRECALFQARQEIMAREEPGGWVTRLLSRQIATFIEAQGPARREGYILAANYSVALLVLTAPSEDGHNKLELVAHSVSEHGKGGEPKLIAHAYENGLAVLVPTGCDKTLSRIAQQPGLACGIGREKPLLSAAQSLEEARLALLSSRLLHSGRPVRYAEMGSERMLLLLHMNSRAELSAFVQETIGPLLKHDERVATPLMPTVASFLKNGGRLRETAAELYVHRNTLAYRLDRAAEILGCDLKNSEARLGIELALKALPLVAHNET